MDRIIVPTALTTLPSRDGRTPHVGVNSFGFGGSNAHALLAPAPALTPVLESVDEPCIFPLSARSPTALGDYANAFMQFIDKNTPPSYAANGGDVICVSNFPDAMLDLPINSPKDNSDLNFEAWTERIPPLKTPVLVILEPEVEKK